MERARHEPREAAREPLVEVSLDELRAFLADDRATVANVLSPEAHRAAHIPGSINLPLADIESRAAERLPDRGRTVVVYCAADT